MISTEVVEHLRTIFSDADLIDIDLSQWDSMISVYVVADHVRDSVTGKRAIVAVRFLGVRRFDWSFRHHAFTGFPLKEDECHHLNWNIYRFDISQGEMTSDLVLSGSEQFPVLRIEFSDVNTELIDPTVFADVNPKWSETTSGLARPGIEQLHNILKRE